MFIEGIQSDDRRLRRSRTHALPRLLFYNHSMPLASDNIYKMPNSINLIKTKRTVNHAMQSRGSGGLIWPIGSPKTNHNIVITPFQILFKWPIIGI